MRFNALLLVGLCLAVALGTVVARMQNRFTVVNTGAQPIKSVTVTVCGRVYSLGPIAPGGSAGSSFRIRGGGQNDYHVHALLQNGSMVSGGGGYIDSLSHGLRDKIFIGHTVVVKDSRMWP